MIPQSAKKLEFTETVETIEPLLESPAVVEAEADSPLLIAEVMVGKTEPETEDELVIEGHEVPIEGLVEEVPETEWYSEVSETPSFSDEEIVQLLEFFGLSAAGEEIDDELIPLENAGIVRLEDQRLAEIIDALETEEAGTVQELLATMNDLTLHLGDVNDMELSLVEEELQTLVEQLFEILGIEYEDDTIEQFVRQFILIKTNSPNTDIYSLEAWFDEGTHEQKTSDSHVLNALIRLVNKENVPLQQIGRWTLRLSLAAA